MPLGHQSDDAIIDMTAEAGTLGIEGITSPAGP